MTANINLADILSAHVGHLDSNRPQTARAYAAIVQRLSDADAGRTAPNVGDDFPRFMLPDDSGRLASAEQFLEKGPVVVSMNRGHWCAFCRYELEALQGISDQISKLGASIVAITPERQAFAWEFKVRCNLGFPILSDIDNGFALSLGLAVWSGDELKPILAEVGIDLEIYQGNPGWIVPIPATYVVERSGRIAARYLDVDFRRRMEPGDILAALEALYTSGVEV